jgi:hypothetical protein
VHVWDYGYGFFITALKENAKLRKEQIKEMAMAARVSQAEADKWKEFIQA